jgi:hypothetical protein
MIESVDEVVDNVIDTNMVDWFSAGVDQLRRVGNS